MSGSDRLTMGLFDKLTMSGGEVLIIRGSGSHEFKNGVSLGCRFPPLILSLSKDVTVEGNWVAFYIYILRYADGSYYTGHTDNVEARLMAHEQGQFSGYTQTHRPVRLVFVEESASRQEAFERERQIKGWSRAKKQAIIKGHWQSLVVLARNRGSTGSP